MSTSQLHALGISTGSIQRKVHARHLHRLYRGVYAVGHTRISLRGRWMAAVLACGPGAALSHRAAAALWDLRGVPSGPTDVTTTARRHHAGIRCHSVRAFDAGDWTTIDEIPVTTVSRTLLDLAEVLRPQPLRSTLEAAQRLDLLAPKAIEQLCARRAGRHGLKPLTAALSELHDEAPCIRSGLERRFLELIRSAGLPEPQTNVVIAGELVDCYWPRHRLVVELDSYRFHKTRQAFENDRRKDARLQMGGVRVARFTDKRIHHEPGATVCDLERLLSAARASAAPSDR